MTRQQFIEAVGREQESLRRFLCLLCGGDSFRADDLAQEALLKAYLSFQRFEGRARFSTWLFRIAYNCFYDSCQEKSRLGSACSVDGPLAASLPDDSGTADRRFENQDLQLAIAGLPTVEQAVILLFYMEEKSVKEIMNILDMPSGTVRSHLSRARAHLREYLTGKQMRYD